MRPWTGPIGASRTLARAGGFTAAPPAKVEAGKDPAAYGREGNDGGDLRRGRHPVARTAAS